MSGSGSAPPAPRGSVVARTLRGASWVIAWRMATRLIGVASTLVLVRLLTPADFGLVALATTFALTIDVCTEIGVEDQIIRSHNPRPELYHTAFTLDLIRAALVGAAVMLLSGPAARFFEDGRLQPVLMALGALTLLGGLTNVGVVDFRRDLQFEKEFKLLLVPRLCGIAVTIAAAFVIAGHWALVLGIAVNRILRIVASYVMHPLRPRLTLSAWRELAGVSFWTWANGIVGTMRERADTFVIGRVLGPAKVGIYSAGMEIAVLPASELIHPICRACFPGFVTSAREGVSLAETWRRIVSLTVLFTLPAGFGLSLVAHDLIYLAYGPTWLEAVPVVAVIGIAVAVSPFGGISQALLDAQTMLRTLFAILAVTTALRVGLLLLLVPAHGLLGAALAYLLGMLFYEAVQVTVALRRLKIPAIGLVRDCWRPALATAAMAGLLWGLGLGWEEAPASAGQAGTGLLLALPLGVACYFGSLALLWLLAGRPAASAEQDVLAAATRGLGAIASRLRRGTAPGLEAGKS